MNVIGSGQTLGATVEGLDLSQRLEDDEVAAIFRARGEHRLIKRCQVMATRFLAAGYWI